MLVLSTRKTVGLHWVLGFMPFVFLLIGAVSDVATLRRYFRWTVWFSLPHLLALAAIVVLPVSVWKGSRLYDDMVFHKKPRRLLPHYVWDCLTMGWSWPEPTRRRQSFLTMPASIGQFLAKGVSMPVRTTLGGFPAICRTANSDFR